MFAWIIFIVSTAFFVFLIHKRLKILTAAKSDPRFDGFRNRISVLIKYGILQKRQPEYPKSGIIHILIFWGFIVLGLRSVEILAQGLFAGHQMHILNGEFGNIYDHVRSWFELATLFACIGAFYIRCIEKPKRYMESSRLEAYTVLFLISFLMVTDLFYEGGKWALAADKTAYPVIRLTAGMLSGFSQQTVESVVIASFWLHIVAFFVFLNLLPLSKHFHVITALPNIWFKKQNPGELKPVDWINPDIEAHETAGAGALTDFTWKQILDVYTCTECGRCTDRCSANIAGRVLSPKKLITEIRDHAYAGPTFVSESPDGVIPGGIVSEAEIWGCTTCGACEDQCPVLIEHVDKIIDLRRHLVMMKSRFPEEIDPLFRNLEIYHNPWGYGSDEIEQWTKEADVPVRGEQTDALDVLYWPGCAGISDERYRKVTRTVMRLLESAEIRFEVMGARAACCGDFARRLGNEYVYQLLVRKNVEALREADVRIIVTSCPHCYNTLKNEYPRFGGGFTVFHHTEYLHQLLHQGKLKLPKPLDLAVTYHDPCYLGRYNATYDIPREILHKVIKKPIIEPLHNRNKAFCCGAGGGYMWLAETGGRINEIRAKELMVNAPDVIATACPYCLFMLTEGTSNMDDSSKPCQIMDIAEIMEMTIQENHGNSTEDNEPV